MSNKKNDSSQFQKVINDKTNQKTYWNPLKPYDPQMQTKSAWEESHYDNKSLKHLSSVKYDILTIVKKPKNNFELNKNPENVKMRQGISKHIDVLYDKRTNKNQYYEVW